MTPAPFALDALLRIANRPAQGAERGGGTAYGVIIAMNGGVEVARWEVPFTSVLVHERHQR